MKRKLIISILLVVAIVFASHHTLRGQIDFKYKINQYDSEKRKHGFWIESNGTLEVYYNHGVLNGHAKTFNEFNRNLMYFCEYKDGELTGALYVFGDYGHLISISKDFKKNISLDLSKTYKRPIPPNQCYHTSFHSNGVIKEEGILLWYDDPLMDDSVEYGEWKYYNKDGVLIKTVVFDF